MISRFLLLALFPLAATECPEFLRGIDSMKLDQGEQYHEAMDVACGRRNYTSAFWSTRFLDYMIFLMSNKTDARQVTLKPLFESLQAKFDDLDSDAASDAQMAAKDFIDAIFEKNVVMMLLNAGAITEKTTEANVPTAMMLRMHRAIVRPTGLTFSSGCSIALMHALKSGFGVPETSVKQRREFVETAMRAIERAGLDDERIRELFGRLYLLVTTPTSIQRTLFDQFVEWTEKQWNSSKVGPLEILPAAEVLYIQYQNLKVNESKSFVDWRIAREGIQHVEEPDRDHISLYTPTALDLEKNVKVVDKLTEDRRERRSEFDSICPSKNVRQCFNALPEEARKEIIATLPELFEFLNRISDYSAFAPTSKEIGPMENNQLELEGSAEGSGMF